jgi:ApaG protein
LHFWCGICVSVKIYVMYLIHSAQRNIRFYKNPEIIKPPMVTATTEGITISVSSHYQPQYSNPIQAHFVFTYRISIENRSPYTIQLMRRHWLIYDANGTIREVEGEGVVGQQPTLEPGQIHEYMSGCNLQTSIGKMEGTYLMERVVDGRQFRVAIPEFTMIASYRLN